MKIGYCLLSASLLLAVSSTPLYARTDGASGPTPSPRLWQLAAQEEAELEQREIILHDSSLTTYLNRMVARLWSQAGSSLSPLQVETVVDSRPQAYTYPNGYTFLTTGMLSRMSNEDQLAMIIAHEMVHYIRQHTTVLYDYYQRPAGVARHQAADSLQSAGDDDIAQKIDAAEYQADKEGLLILIKAGYCGSQVPAMISNLMKNQRNRAKPGTVKRLENRLACFRTMLGQVGAASICTSAPDGGRTTYLNGIAPALVANAQAAVQRGDWQQADKSVSLLQATIPADARVYYLQGEILRRRGGAEGQTGCIGYYEKALQIDPGFPSAQRALGEVYFKAGRLRKAKPYFEAFLSLAPQDDASEYIKGYLRQCQQ